MTGETSAGVTDGRAQCWCCGALRPAGAVVRLGDHPEVALCFPCAHWAHQQARSREDAARPSPATWVRDALRAGRRWVMRHGWQHTPLIGGALRWLGTRLP